MRSNLLALAILLLVIGLVAALRRPHPPAGPYREIDKRETIEPSEGEVPSLGYRVGDLELGDPRQQVEELGGGPRSGWQSAAFPNGLRGMFPSCPRHADVVAFNRSDELVAARGHRLMLPDGRKLGSKSTYEDIVAAVGEPEHQKDLNDAQKELVYSSRGLRILVIQREGQRDYTLDSVSLTPPWK
ncbi:MAG: hypothetical protein KC910_13340 [Candidatus Eremiobacteraeota bacterium]|nr:hypothetical protein [Candidatus Eremiobacteraeota bacterium]